MEAFETRRAVLCLGAARVDLVCSRPAECFVPQVGGAAATVALVAAAAGVPVALAGATGDDGWGTWLQARLSAAGVDTSRVAVAAGLPSRLAFVTVDADGCASVTPHGAGAPGLAGTDPRVADASCLFLSAETLVDAEDRDLTMRARSVALEHDVPVVFAPAVSHDGWRSAADAAASLNAVVPGALLVCVSAEEATLMTGEEGVERAALALVKAGARLVVIRDGEGAVLRGELRADAEVQAVWSFGAAEVFCGTLLARLALSDFYPPVVAASLRDALAGAARG